MNETVTKRSRKILSVFLAVLMIISSMPFVSITASADGTTIDSLVITVVNSSDVGISNASVTLDSTTKTTNGNGEVTFYDVAVENKEVTVSANGYADNSVTLVLTESTTTAEVEMKRLYTVTGKVKSNVDGYLSNYTVTATDGENEVNVTKSGSTFSYSVTEGNDTTYTVTSKNHNSVTGTINSINEAKNVGDVELQAKTQTITVTVTNDGTAKINTKEFDKNSTDNTIDIDFNDDTYDFSATAGEGYHISSISGAISYTNSFSANDDKNAVKSYPTSGVDRVAIDKSKTSQTINVVFEINSYNIAIKGNPNYVFTVNGIEYKNKNKDYSVTFTHGTIIPIKVYAIGVNSIDTVTIGDMNYGELSDPALEDFYTDDGDYEFSKTVLNGFVISASTRGPREPVDNSSIAIDEPIFREGNNYYYNQNVNVENVVYKTSRRYETNISYNDTNNDDHSAKNQLTFEKTTSIGRIDIATSRNNWHPVTGTQINFIIDKTNPRFNKVESTPSKWTNEVVTVSGSVTDEKTSTSNENASGIDYSGIDYLAYSTAYFDNISDLKAAMIDSEGSPATAFKIDNVQISSDKKTAEFSFDVAGEQDKNYYVYVVDRVQNMGTPTATKVQIDKTKPFVSSIKFKDKKGEELDFKEYGTDTLRYSSNKDVVVEIDVKDPVSNDASSSFKDVKVFEDNGDKQISDDGNHKVTVYKEPVIKTEGEGKYYYAVYRFTLKFGEHAKDWTKIKAQVTDNAGNVSCKVNKTEAEELEKQFELMLSNVVPMATITEAQDCDFKEKLSKDEADSETEKPDSQKNYSVEEAGDKYRNWYKDGDIKFNVVAKDNNGESDSTGPSLKNVKIYINGGLVRVANYNDYNKNQEPFDDISIYDKIVDEDGKPTDSDIELKEGKNTVKVEVTNNNTESAEAYYYFYRDVTHPKFIKAEFTKPESGATDKILELLTFGVFSNNDVNLTLEAVDSIEGATDQSKIATIKLYNGDKLESEKIFDEDNRNTKEEHTFTIKMDDGYIGNLFVKVIDSVGNVNYISADTNDGVGKISIADIADNDEIKSDYIVLEDMPPTISSSSLDTPDNADANTKTVVRDEKGNPTKWYASDNIDILVEYMDSGIHSGLYESSLTLNGDYIIQNAEEGETPKKSHRIYHKYAADDEQAYTEMTEESNFLINAGNAVTHNDDGSYNLKATVRDNAGNKGADYEETFYVDRDAPNVIDFEFDREYYQEPVDGNRGAEKNKAEVKNYGYYFNDATTVTITADDSEGPSSGVKFITVRFINHDGKITYDDVTADVDENNQARFEIPEGFKGQVIACATDNVNHTGDFVTPDGVIYEVNKPDIAFNDPTFAKKDKTDTGVKSKEQAPYVLNKISNGLSKQEVKAKKNNTYYKNELFNSNAYLPFVIDDAAIKDSGIRKIEWSITAKSAKNELASGYYTIDNNRKFDEKVNKGNNSKLASISIDHKKDEKNLVHRVTGKFLIGDDYNDIIVSITVTDRSGNTRTKSKVISVDKTAPKIKLEFADKDKETGKYSSYYNKDREAIITVKERNFDPARIDYIIDNIDKDYSSSPDISKSIVNIKNWSCEWKKSKDNKTHGYSVSNPDNSTYVYRIKFKVDKNDGNGDFKLRFNLQDMAHNKSNKAMSDFVLDGIDPTIKVTYSDKGKNKKNANYFNEDVTITVLVTEHNINVGEFNKLFKNLIDQVNNGDKKKKISQPKFSGFKHVGKDQYEATVVCKENARYFINMSIEDMAGNIFTLAEKRTKKDWYQFDVDHDKPEIEFGGDVKDLDKYEFASYNNQKFVPVITITDKDGNLDDVIDSKSFVIRTKGTLHREQTYDYFASSDEMKIEKVTNGYRFTLNYFEPKSYELDDVYVMEVVAVDKAGNEIKSNPQYFSVNRYGSTYKYDLLDIRFDEDALFNDILYTKAFVKKNNPVTVFTEYNCDNIKTNETELKLVYTNTNQQTEKEIELKENVNYIVVPDKNNKKTFNTKQYAYQLIDEELFNEDGVYEIYATTKDAAKNTNKNTVAVEKVNKTRRIIKFVVDNTAPRMDAKSTFEKIDYIDNNIYDIDTSNQKSQIRDDMFSSDGSSCTFKVSIDEENLGLDAIDVSKLNVNFDNKKIVVKDTDIVDENGVYDVSFKLDAPDNLTKTGDLVISIKDRAGLERVWSAKGLQISNNWFIRFINNKLALGITISIIVLIALGISVFFIVKRRKERDDEE